MKRSMVAVLSLLAVMAMADVSSATTTPVDVGDTMWFSWTGGGLLAGPMTAHLTNKPGTFDTFCLTPSGTIWVNGGTGYQYQVRDPLVALAGTQKHAGWLYLAYLDGSLPGYVNDVGHNNALQYGMWSSMGLSDVEMAVHGNSATVIAAAKALYSSIPGPIGSGVTYNWGDTSKDNLVTDNIVVANLRYLNNPGEDTQDIMVLTMNPPGPGNPPVPEPVTMVSLFLAVSGLGVYLRKRTRVVAQ